MAISIEEAMALPIMKETRLVAGQDGLSNLIKWVTIVEVLEDINRLQEGEFLITTGFGLLESDDKKEKFIQLLGQKKLSGVAMYTGFYLPEIPESLITVANEHNLPLIEISTDINFSKITKAILEQIINNQMQLLEDSLSIHKELTRLVLENKGAKEITTTLANLTDAAIIVYNDIQTIENIVTKNITLNILAKTGLNIDGEEFNLKDKLESSSKLRIPSHFHTLNYHVSIYPIIANNQSYGSIVAIKRSDMWREMDDIAIEHAGTVFAIEALRKVAIEETRLRLQGTFLDEIIDDHITNKAYALEQGKKLGYDLSSSQAFFYLYIQKNKSESSELQSLESKLFQTVNEVLKNKNQAYMGRAKLDSLMLLVNIVGETDQEKEQNCYWLAKEINKQWLYFFPKDPLIIGIGRCYDGISMLSQSAKEAQLAVSLSGVLIKPNTIVHYKELGTYHLLINMKEAGIDLEKLYSDTLDPLLKHARQGTDLLETLDVYLYNNQNIQITAGELFIHRHTLKYRLNQIETKTGLQLKSADDRMQIQLAIMAYKLLTQTGEIH
ncbi:PucR family transcriptional regulator [Paenisporosarcina sp. TG-14]|uniref:PucR family transcriptional regulator n=1 Tax=Paenisporosarcina sp. TG-14 TaxID=1231057 RepID=UPI00030D62E1|nr:PucR family transcriptional regulator [Paenisporosarcina sp. TG-14]